jgi:hypothetical protein
MYGTTTKLGFIQEEIRLKMCENRMMGSIFGIRRK